MANYQQYAEYKELESIFVEKIPANWSVKPLYTLCGFKQGKAHEPFIDDDGEFICVNARFVSTQGKGGSVKRCNVNLTSAKLNDILMVMSDLPNGRALARAFYVTVPKNNYAVNQRVCVITAREVHAKFLYYQLNRSPYFLMFDDGSNQTHLSNDSYKKYPVILPSTIEQTQIANFLDFETAQIDTLIEKQQTLIQLLKEKRQAVISHAVTKGLNPNAPMKDSGVEWLGGIPSHWNMQKLKYVGEAKNGLTYSPDNVTEAGIGTLVLRSSNIQNAQLSFEDNVYVDMKIPERILVRTDDILICSRNGSRRLIGKNALITEDVAGQAFGAFMVVFRSEINTYLYWILNSPLFEYQSGSFLTSTINQLTIGNLHSMEIPIPPKKEQDEIEKYLKTKMIDFDKLISKAEQAIKLMQERRTALISAAVTGKIDVRGWVAPDVDSLE